jgi:hypothetical protein
MTELQVKEILNQRQISVSEFAKILGVAREHCYNIINGRNLSFKQIENMAKVLNLPIRALFTPPTGIESEYNPYEIVYGRTEKYKANDIVTFCKLDGKYGRFSNMHTAYPVNLFGHHCYTSEHAFVAMRFSGHPDFQKQILDYKNSMWCKKTFVNNSEYKKLHHPHWHDNYLDVEIMKYIILKKYEQNAGFRKLLNETKGKIIVEDTTTQNSSNAVLRWGCQDFGKKDLLNETRKDVRKYITSHHKELKAKEAELKKPRCEQAQAKYDAKRKAENKVFGGLRDIYEKSILENCNYELVGENAMGKILTEIRDTGTLQYNIEYPVYFFGHEIK